VGKENPRGIKYYITGGANEKTCHFVLCFDYLYELTFEGNTLKKIESVGSGTSYDGCRSAEERRILGED